MLASKKPPFAPVPRCRHNNPPKECWDCNVERSDKTWWTAALWPTAILRLFRAAGRSRYADAPWADSFVRARWRKRLDPTDRALTIKAARRLADNPDQAIAFDSVYRLHGSAGASRWLADLVNPPAPPMANTDALALAHAAKARKVQLRKDHARAMLRKWQRALRRAEVATARWGRVVARYDREDAKKSPAEDEGA